MKKVRVIGVIVALLIVLTALTSCDKLKLDDVKADPMKYISDGITLTLEKTPLANIYDPTEKSSYQLILDGENTSTDMKLYLDTSAAKGAVELSLELPSDYSVDETTGELSVTSTEKIALDAYYIDNQIVLRSDMLSDYIGTNAIGLDTAVTVEDIKASALYNALLSLTGSSESGITEDSLSDTVEAVTKAFSNYITACTDIGNSALEFGEITEETIEIDGKNVKTIAVPYSIKEGIYDSVADELIKAMKEIMTASGAAITDEEIGTMEEQIKSSMPDMTMAGKVYLSAKTGAAVKETQEIKLALTAEEETTSVKITAETVYGADPTTAFLPSVNLEIDIDGEKLTINGSSSVSDGKFLFEGEAKLDAEDDAEDDGGTFKFELSPDGKFNLTLTDSEDEFVLPGTFTSDETKTEFTIDLSAGYDEEEIADITEIKFVITAGEEVPALPEYKDILDMTEEDLAPLMMFAPTGDIGVYELTAEDCYYILSLYYEDTTELDATLDDYASYGYASRDDMIFDGYISLVMDELLSYMDEASINDLVQSLVNEGCSYGEIATALDQTLYAYAMADTSYSDVE